MTQHCSGRPIIQQAVELTSTAIMDALSPAAAFARSLKTYDDVILDGEGKEKKQTRRAVVHFDDAKFIAKCKPSSPDYDVELCNYEEITSELFAVGEVWSSRDLVHSTLRLISDMHGWTVKMEKNYLSCNRFGHPTASRQYTQGDLHGTSFHCLLILLPCCQSCHCNLPVSIVAQFHLA